MIIFSPKFECGDVCKYTEAGRNWGVKVRVGSGYCFFTERDSKPDINYLVYEEVYKADIKHDVPESCLELWKEDL